LLSYAGIQFGGDALFFGLHVGIFPLWLPVVLIAQEMTKNSPRKDFWKIAMSGCPVWMKYMASGFFGYAIVNFLLFMFTPTGSINGHEISYDAKFCSGCGVSTDEEDEKIR